MSCRTRLFNGNHQSLPIPVIATALMMAIQQTRVPPTRLIHHQFPPPLPRPQRISTVFIKPSIHSLHHTPSHRSPSRLLSHSNPQPTQLPSRLIFNPPDSQATSTAPATLVNSATNVKAGAVSVIPADGLYSRILRFGMIKVLLMESAPRVVRRMMDRVRRGKRGKQGSWRGFVELMGNGLR